MSDKSRTFTVVHKRNAMKIIYRGRFLVGTPKPVHNDKYITSKQMVSLINVVSRSVNDYLRFHRYQIEVVEKQNGSTFTNHTQWENLQVGEVFYYVDISRCYWTIAWQKNYISNNIYKKYVNKYGYKTYLSMALGCLKAAEHRDYYVDGKFITSIEEWTEPRRTIYTNIRHTSWNHMGTLHKLIGDKCYGYRVDGIMVTRDAIPEVRDYLDSHNFNFTVKKCRKADQKHYYDEQYDRLKKI